MIEWSLIMSNSLQGSISCKRVSGYLSIQSSRFWIKQKWNIFFNPREIWIQIRIGIYDPEHSDSKLDLSPFLPRDPDVGQFNPHSKSIYKF